MRKGKFSLHKQIASGDIDGIRSLLEEDSSCINTLNSKNQTPLHIAATLNNFAAIEILKEYGANPNIKDAHGSTPLHRAIPNADLDSIKLLITMGTKLNEVDRYSNTALHLASYLGSEQIIKELLENGAHPNLLNKNWMTPLSIAISTNNLNSIQIIKSYNGKTPRSMMESLRIGFNSSNNIRKNTFAIYSSISIGASIIGVLMTNLELLDALLASVFSSFGLFVILFNKPYQRVRHLEEKTLNGSMTQSQVDYLLFSNKKRRSRSKPSNLLSANNDNVNSTSGSIVGKIS